jgi:ABC-type glycerol-3-phosphate transport system substrate-binding protein
LQGVQITFWHFLPEDQITPLLRAFNQDNPWGITVTARRFFDANQLSEAVLELQANDTGPAPVVLGYPEQLRAWAAAGQLTDLTVYSFDPAWGLSDEDLEAFVPVFWAQDLSGDVRLGVPARRDANFLLYNQSWADELNYRLPPDRPERFKAQSCAANTAMKQDRDVQNDAYGGWQVNTAPETMLAWIRAFGGQPVRASQPGYNFDTQQTETAFAFLKDLIDSGCAWVSTAPYPDEAFASRQALLATASLNDLIFIQQAFTAADNADEWTVLAYPGEERQAVMPIFGPSFALMSDSPARQLAGWVFIRWMASAETQAFWTRLDGQFPVSFAARALLSDYVISHPQWAAAWELLPNAVVEPSLASWGDVRWALQDAGTQVFRSYFTPDRIPATLQELDRTAAELSQEAP